MLSRRHMLFGSSAALLLAACGGDDAATEAVIQDVAVKKSSGKPVGIQTYTLRESMEQSTPDTLAMIKQVGFDYVELNERDFTRTSVAELRSMLDDAGLPARATHVGYDTAMADPKRAIVSANTLGCDYVILPWIGEEFRSTDGYKYHAQAFNQIGEMMAREGKRFAYHNHQFEFWDIDGPRNGMDILLEETNPETVFFELDLFWTALGGADPSALFRAHPGRFKLCHIKDMKGDPGELADGLEFERIGQEIMVDVGKGDLPFQSWFDLNDVSGMEYFIVEHDHPKAPYAESIGTSLQTVRGYTL